MRLKFCRKYTMALSQAFSCCYPTTFSWFETKKLCSSLWIIWWATFLNFVVFGQSDHCMRAPSASSTFWTYKLRKEEGGWNELQFWKLWAQRFFNSSLRSGTLRKWSDTQEITFLSPRKKFQHAPFWEKYCVITSVDENKWLQVEMGA